MKFLVAFISLCLLANLVAGTSLTLSQSLAQFALDLYENVVGSRMHRDAVISPFSVQMDLGMALMGAGGRTAEVMINGLDLVGDQNSIAADFHNLLVPLQNTSSVLTVINKIYVSNKYNILDTFNAIAAAQFYSSAESIDFTNTEAAANTVNQWVASQTNNLIKHIIYDDDIDNSTAVLLVNAIHFKGVWQYQFDPSQTYSAPFYSNENRTISIDTMHMTGQFNYAHIDSLNAQLLQIPYQDSQYSMYILLPNDQDGIQAMEKSIGTIDLTALKQQLNNANVTLSLPKFKTEFQVFLTGALQRLGLGKIFSKSADFSGIFDNGDGVPISDVVQKAFIEVDEQGTEAVAATGVSIRSLVTPAAPPPAVEFNANHPYVYYIEDLAGNIYFIGRYLNREE